MAALPDNEEDTTFGMIMKGKIKTDFVYQDDKCVVFKDINPMTPVHYLVVPLVEPQDGNGLPGHLMLVARRVVKELNLVDYRVVLNTGSDSTLTEPHLHLHILGSTPLG